MFLGGIVAYTDLIKQQLLEVPHALIAEHGAVSEAVACAMAEGVRRNFGASVTVSVTGIAGPTGGSEAKPVGTVWLATAAERGTQAVRKVFGGSRADIRARAAQAALWLMLERMGAP